MRALTLLEPWATAVAELSKNIENRSRVPPRALLGQRFVIHAGSGDSEWCEFSRYGTRVPLFLPLVEFARSAARPPTAGRFVAFVSLAAVLRPDDTCEIAPGFEAEAETVLARPSWYMGEVGYVLTRTIKIPDPELFGPARGALGFWQPVADVSAALDALDAELRAQVGW